MKTNKYVAGIGILALAATLFLNMGTLMAQRTEPLDLEIVSNTDQCLIDCETVFKAKAGRDLTLNREDISLWIQKQYGNEADIQDLKIEVLTEKEEYVEVPKTKLVEEKLKCEGSLETDGTIAHCIGKNLNETEKDADTVLWETEYVASDGETVTYIKEVPDGTELKPTTIREYADYADKTMAAGRDIYFKVTGKRAKARLGPNSVDWKINILGNQPQWAWWSSSWGSKKLITLNQSVNNGVQVPLNISYTSSMKSTSFADLRFTDYSEDTELPYWIQSYVAGSWAYVWVKMSETSDKLYMYYNNDGATSASNGSLTFSQWHGYASSNFMDTVSLSATNFIYTAYVTFSGSHNCFWGLSNHNTHNDDYTLIELYYTTNRRHGQAGNEGVKTEVEDNTGITSPAYIHIKRSGSGSIYTYVGSSLIGSAISSNKPDENMAIYFNPYSGSCSQYWSYYRAYVTSDPTATFGTEETYNHIPALISQELYPTSPTEYDNLTLKIKCTDADASDTITAYWNCYKDNMKQNAYSSSMTVANNTNTTVETIDNADTTVGEEWYCNIYCSDGKTNTTTENTTTRTIQAGCTINANCSQCTGWIYLNATENRTLQVRDNNGNGKYDQICCNETVTEITVL